MGQRDAKSSDEGRTNSWLALRNHYRWVIAVAILVSILGHGLTVRELGMHRFDRRIDMGRQQKSPIKIRVTEVTKPKSKTVPEPKDKSDASKILETPQEKTAAPDQARYLGTVNHQAKQEMRIKEPQNRQKAQDAGQKGNPNAKEAPKVAAEARPPQKAEASPKQSDIKIKSDQGRLSVGAFTPDRKPRNNYEALLPTNVSDLPGQISAGFQDYVDDKALEGDRIDISTSEYRFIGYFTGLRKAIELVWTYPNEASQRGMQGEVGLEFAISRDGRANRIRVIKSSGYPILDRAIVDAIKLASPFSPLPAGFGRDKIVVTGSFRYILSAYGSH